MNIDLEYERKVRDWIKDTTRNISFQVVYALFDRIFPRPMDKAALLYALVDYCLEDDTAELQLPRTRFLSRDGRRQVYFFSDEVLAKIDPDSKDTFLKLQRLRRKQFLQRLRRVELDGVPGVRTSVNWKLIYDRLSEEYEKVLAQRANSKLRSERECEREARAA